MRKMFVLIALLVFTLSAAKITCSATEILQTTSFKAGVSLPWNISESDEMNSYSKIVNGEYMVHIDQAGANRWDVQIRHREISIVKGHSYTVHFKLHATKACKIYARIGDMGDPYHDVWSNKFQNFTVPAGATGLNFTDTFIADADSKAAEFAFHLGGELAGSLPNEIFFTEISLDGQFFPPPTPIVTPPREIRVNQLGYYPQAEKKATLVSTSTSAIDVQLKNSSGTVVWTGKSQPKSGTDIASGDKVHIIDFSDFKTVGKNYQLVAGTATSFQFDIGMDMYSQMKYDSLRYFYYARSGIVIEMPYCIESRWARPAGHPADIATLYPNKPYSDGLYSGGPESIDCTGGWYDAGDYGKYVVNGGVATWSLQNQYERAMIAGKDAPYADGKMNIPESSNNYPDLLDEARYNMEYLLKAQIPKGYTKEGMAIHKMGDEFWTALGVSPDQDTHKRYFYPPSTAATLNLAACAAQASRLWKTYDQTFSSRCLNAAEEAWAAAEKYPEVFAPSGQEISEYPYNSVKDEFYWAACELYITTGKAEYLDFIKASQHYLKVSTTLNGEQSGNAGCFNPDNTSSLGTIDIALCAPAGVDTAAAKSAVAAAADVFLGIQAKEAYGVPLAVSTYVSEFAGQTETIADGYPWASNSFIVNQSMVMAYAYDYTGDKKYINGVTEAMDYICGRNPNIKCYVSGYGENPLKYPYHQFFCPQIDSTFPSVPPGFLSGGPNSGCQDPWASGSGLKGSPAMKCYIDHVESWSTNEVTINLNASLAWLTGYLDEIVFVPPFPTPTSIVKSLDVNGDGAINMSDVMLVASGFGSIRESANYKDIHDLNSDGAINMSDIMMIAAKFNTLV